MVDFVVLGPPIGWHFHAVQPRAHPMAVRGEAEMGGEQGHEGDGGGGVGRDVEVEIHDRVQQ